MSLRQRKKVQEVLLESPELRLDNVNLAITSPTRRTPGCFHTDRKRLTWPTSKGFDSNGPECQVRMSTDDAHDSKSIRFTTDPGVSPTKQRGRGAICLVLSRESHDKLE